MRSSIVFTTLFTATVLASPRPNVEIVQIRQVERRQDTSSIDLGDLIPSGCIFPTDIAPVPTAPLAVASAFASFTNPCAIPSITGSAASQYSSYTSALSSWAKENSAKIESWESAFKTACPLASVTLPSVSLPSNTALLSLSIASCGATLKSGGDATGTATGSGSTGAAPQQTVFAAAAGILAGFAGVVAAF
ncbi:hypothetical protein K505DRAFT_321270 [Melanomma pulvis-pyrius CBS 109.77]|uniref:Infection structure specific protein n=1 Tax=Melanomma pulvis-pyrius CBS 109.77 TaxID=1314802 RepID=A0A6A6XTD5_9PLEO|nr:hypothetical protein K505DRAFT_321270 [Melanomma pulvis-pyrius CBS 109.77]